MTDRELGPIDYALIEFPGNKFNGRIAPEIVSLVERGLITIMDLVFVKKDEDGTVTGLEVTDMDADEVGSMSVFAADFGEVLSEEDIQQAGGVLEPGTSAMFAVWENTWAAPLVAAIYESGGLLASTGRIPALEMLAALDAETG